MIPCLTLRLFVEGSQIVVRSVERDIAAQGATLEEALLAWATVVATTVVLDRAHGREPLSDTPPWKEPP
jgi:hypothetical protein